MVVINPNRPETDLFDKYSVNHLPKGVTDVSFEEYLTLINDHCSSSNKVSYE